MTQKVKKSQVSIQARCILLRDEDFSRCLEVIYGGLGISKLRFLIQKNINFISAVNFLPFVVIKTFDLDPYPDPH